MFLFPWLDWGIDISDFEKIDFLAHEPYLAFLAPWKGAFLDPQVEFRPHSGGVEYSTCLKIFIFWKYNVSAFKWRVERFYTTLRKNKAACLRKKHPKNHPQSVFDWRVSTCGISEIIAKIWIIALLLHVSAGIPAETCSGRAKLQIFAIISGTPQVVLKRF